MGVGKEYERVEALLEVLAKYETAKEEMEKYKRVLEESGWKGETHEDFLLCNDEVIAGMTERMILERKFPINPVFGEFALSILSGDTSGWQITNQGR